MGCREVTPSTGVYRPRQPHASPLYRCVRAHWQELEAGGAIRRGVERETLGRFIDCGDLHRGFTRLYCDACGHDYLLAFSCKTRYFCPSCHQKRMLAYGDWVEQEVLQPVPHRQYVFTLPKVLRPHYHRRHRLGELCRIVAALLCRGYGAMADHGKPGLILFVQTFGDLVNFHPHIHVLASDGVITPSGTFRVLPPVPPAELNQAFREAVIAALVADDAIESSFADKLLGWRHSGFSVDAGVRIAAGDSEGRKRLARYMIRNPFSLAKMEYKPAQGVVVYRSKLHATLKRNFQLLPGAAWLKLLLCHIPDKGEHLVRYCGWYSNRARGERRRAAQERPPTPGIRLESADVDLAFRQKAKRCWAQLIRRVYEVDPLECPHCGAEMRLMALIQEAPVIERILRHLGRWQPLPPLRGPPEEDDWPSGGQLEFSIVPLPPIA